MSDPISGFVTLINDLQARIAALEKAAGVAPPAKKAGAAPAAGASPAVSAYDSFIADSLNPLLDCLKSLGDEGVSMAGFLDKGFNGWSRGFLVMASNNKKPKKADMNAKLGDWMKEGGAIMKEANQFRDNRSPFKEHMNAVNEAIQALNWIFVEPTPCPLVKDYIDGTLFWSNKVLVANKKKGDEGKPHMEFANKLKAMLQALHDYIKEYHTTGVVYNRNGGENYSYGTSSASASTATAAPAAAKKTVATKTAGGGGGAKADLFASIKGIDQSSGKTAGLKHVKKSEMTHKNTALRGKSAVKAAPKKKAAPVVKGTPKLECSRNRWICEYQTGPVEVTIGSVKEELYIYGCVGATITVKGKVKAITMDGCKTTNLVMDSAISSIEFVNCKRAKAQILGKVPSVTVDKTDGFGLYLSKDGLDTAITTSKSSEMNVSFPHPTEADEWIEKPIPEQFVSRVDTSALSVKTSVSELYSS